MSSGIHDTGFEYLHHQQDMDFQHLRGNILGWQQLKRQHSPPRDIRPLKKRYGTENISPELRNAKVIKATQGISQNNIKKYLNNKHPLKENGKETVVEPHKRKDVDEDNGIMADEAPENDFDMDDIIPLDINLSKPPIKYCDDRLYVDLVTRNDVRNTETLSRDNSRQANENFREKMRKPLKELLDILDIRTEEEPLQYILVGLKLQMLGWKLAKSVSTIITSDDKCNVPENIDATNQNMDTEKS